MMNNKHIGSSFDDFLEGEGIMVDTQAAGTTIDHAYWASLQVLPDTELSSRLWIAVVREIAQAVLDSQTDNEDTTSEQLIGAWYEDSLPLDHELPDILGDTFILRQRYPCWDDVLSKVYCEECIDDAVISLKDALTSNPDGQDAVDDEMVKSFFAFWRSRFLQKVIDAAKILVEV